VPIEYEIKRRINLLDRRLPVDCLRYERGMRPIRRTARGLLSLSFIASGAKTLLDPEEFVADAQPVIDRAAPVMSKATELLPAAVTRRGIALPTDARALIRLNGAIQLGAGVLMLTRLHRPAAAVLAGSLIPATVAAHPFWQYADPARKQEERLLFTKNLGLLGGLLLAAADTQGRPSLRYRAHHALHHTNESVSRTARTARAHLPLPLIGR
jgi:uncharacterized membrane protein YphA (DoxX/SURF4 family)